MCLMFFHFIYPLSVVTFGFDRLVTVCLHIWNAKERERGIKNSDRLGEKKEGKVRGRTDNGEMEKREICIGNTSNDYYQKWE